MIHHFTIGCWILLFLTPGYTPVFAKDEVIKVPHGLDATLRCRSETSLPPKWEWGSNQTSDNIKTLVVNSTAYLLVENFQEMNEGNYHCVHGTGKESAVKLRFSSPEAQKHTGEFRLAVRNVTLARNAWECAVFHQGRLRALVPFTLTVKRRATQPPKPSAGGDRPGHDPKSQNHSEISLIYLSLVCLSGLLLISVGTAFIIHCCRRHQGDEQTPDDANYNAVHFKMKKAADSSTSAALDTDNLTPEEDS